MLWDVFLMQVWMWLKILIPKLKGDFWKDVKFAVAVRKSELNVVLILWIAEFDSYECKFLAENNKRENMYCDFSGRIFRFVNNWQKESLFLAFIIILFMLSWILKPL